MSYEIMQKLCEVESNLFTLRYVIQANNFQTNELRDMSEKIRSIRNQITEIENTINYKHNDMGRL